MNIAKLLCAVLLLAQPAWAANPNNPQQTVQQALNSEWGQMGLNLGLIIAVTLARPEVCAPEFLFQTSDQAPAHAQTCRNLHSGRQYLRITLPICHEVVSIDRATEQTLAAQQAAGYSYIYASRRNALSYISFLKETAQARNLGIIATKGCIISIDTTDVGFFQGTLHIVKFAGAL